VNYHYDAMKRAYVDDNGEVLLTEEQLARMPRGTYDAAADMALRFKKSMMMECPSCFMTDKIDRTPQDADVYACGHCRAPAVAHVRDDQVVWTQIMPHQLDAMNQQAREHIARVTRIKAPGTPQPSFRMWEVHVEQEPGTLARKR
jgi:hypothetical protein